MFPVLWAGSRIGLKVGNLIEKDRRPTLAYLILLAVGVSAIGPTAASFFNSGF